MTIRFTTRRPKYQRCDSCGRNKHKVVVAWPDGKVRGYCPKCWAEDGDFTPRAWAEEDGAKVTCDMRKGRS